MNCHNLYYTERAGTVKGEWGEYYKNLINYQDKKQFVVSVSKTPELLLENFIAFRYVNLNTQQKALIEEIIKSNKSAPRSDIYYDLLYNHHYFAINFGSYAVYYKL